MPKIKEFKNCRKDLVSDLKKLFDDVKQYRHNKKKYYNFPCAFDIETTSFYEKGEKRAIMYVWQWAFGCDLVVYGRTWEEFNEFIAIISKTLQLTSEHRLICFVHNLSYEFEFIRHYFKVYNMLATKPYKPIRFSTSAGIDFKCSYMLSQQSLMALSKNYNLKYYKKSNYDYNIIRNSKTELTESEIDYITSDVLAVCEYIFKEINIYKKISMIPNTATAKVRQQTRTNTIGMTHQGGRDNGGAQNYKQLINQLTLDPEEFRLAHQSYQGGFTHSNALNTNVTLHNVASQDFISSYPAVMVLYNGFPMSKGKHLTDVTSDVFYHLLDYYAVIFNATFFNIRPKVKHENVISVHKCQHITSDRVLNNGRVYSAAALQMSLTDLDFKVIQKFYEWDSFIINDLYYYRKGYLPKKLVLSVLNYYGLKTTLKGVHSDDGIAEANYLMYKGYVNSLYGMCCMNPCKPETVYEEEWDEKPTDLITMVEKYNNDRNRFLSYLWGVYISASARYNLCIYGILPLGNDYVYADTDSVKYLHPEKHKKQFEDYNRMILEKIKMVSKKRRIPIESFMPETPAGEKAIIGQWSFEGIYYKFRTCGAKRYIYEINGRFGITVAGLQKKTGSEYIKSVFDDPFETFNETLYIPKGFTGKQTHTYCDYEISGRIKDYQGHIADYHEMSFIHLEDADYDFNITADYLRFIRGVKNEIK